MNLKSREWVRFISYLAVTLIHVPPSPQVHAGISAHAEDNIHFAMQKQGLDNFKIEEGLPVILGEQVTLVSVISPIERRSLSLLVWDWALASNISRVLADLASRGKDGWLVYCFPRRMGAQTVDSRTNLSNSGIVEDDVVRVRCLVLFGMCLSGL